MVVLVTTGVAGLTVYYRLARRLGLEEAQAITAFGINTMRRAYSAYSAGYGPTATETVVSR